MSDFLIDRTPVVDKVYGDLKNRIVSGDVAPGAKLAVRALCEYYGVSDTPVKQAMNRLVTEKLVEALPHRGMRVRLVTAEDIAEAFEVRKMIELYAVPFALAAAKNGTLIKSLKENLAENERLAASIGEGGEFSASAAEELRVSRAFHKLLVASVGNKRIEALFDATDDCQYLYYQQKKDKKAAILASIAEHRAILDRLIAGDPSGLTATVRTHLEKRASALLAATRNEA